MGLQSDKFTLQGLVQPWRCDVCQEMFEPELKGICTRCGKLLCPAHRTALPNPEAPAGREVVCPGCSEGKGTA
jgi:DNA-directed RNA polymerase subunit RPC12/RpoP